MRALALQMRGYAEQTQLTIYQAKLLSAAWDLEMEADRLDRCAPPQPSSYSRLAG